MKKFVTLALALAMCAGLCVPASAAKTVASTQNLSVDGAPVACEKYNIDGANYFKLRDLAALLNGSKAQFSVGYDAASNSVSITTGGIYQYNGSELAIGADKSSTSVESRQSILVNGSAISNVSVYNIGGNNYFKLRDLGAILGFEVGYDDATRTATVKAEPMGQLSRFEYDAKGNLVKDTLITDTEMVVAYTYDAAGNCLTETYTYDSGMPGYVIHNDYDAAGRLVKSATEYSAGDSEITSYTYDKNGFRLTETYTTGDSSIVITNTPDAKGNIATRVITEGSSEVTRTAYTYDAAGKVLTESCRGVDYSYDCTYTYDAKGNLTRESYKAPEYSYERTYTYDAKGNETFTHYVSGDGLVMDTKTSYAYDKEGRVIWSECWDDAVGGTITNVNIYNGAGQKVLTRSYTAMG